MLSTLCAFRIPLFATSRNFSLNLIRHSRFNSPRNHFQNNYARAKQKFKSQQPVEKIDYHGPDSIPVRPLSHLWRAAGFTAVFTVGVFTYSCISHYEIRRWRNMSAINQWFKSYWVEINTRINPDGKLVVEKRIKESNEPWAFTPGQKLILALVGTNLAVYLMWKFMPQNFMWRFFTNGFASKSLYLPMLTSAFSHHAFWHLFLNMYVLNSFGAPLIDRKLGDSQFIAMYLSAGVFSSLTSLIQKGIYRIPTRALGASGAIMAVLTYACITNPEARLNIIFLPFFSFSAEQALYGIVGLDALGVLLGWRIFDHAAHLGGAIFGILYGLYGEKFYREVFYPKVIQTYKEWRKN